MNAFYDAVYLSPHLDDAALSCGGQIYQLAAEGKSVLVVTVMAGDPASRPSSQFAQSLHQRWQLESNTVEARRAEDAAACRVLGADWQHWDFLDCIYRIEPETERPLYTSDEGLFGEIDPADFGLIDKLVGKMTLLPAHEQLYVPLTLGHHVDHQLTRQAAERAFPAAERTFSAPSLLYYEDYPYAERTAAEQFAAQEAGSWQAKVIELTENGVAARINAIQCFKSQLSTFFKNGQDLAHQVRIYIETVGGERVWMVVQEKRRIA
jgi:LmbE family N-acetylglucosaminyl deacetylase